MRPIGRMPACVAAVLCAAFFDRTAAAYTPSSRPSAHLVVYGRRFNPSADGLRTYLETMRSINPALYARLVPDVERLEKRHRIEQAVFITGMSLGLASVAVAAYAAISDVRDCPAAPAAGDPNFAVDSAASSACDDRHVHTFAAFGLIGMTLMCGSILTALILSPSRAELQEIIDKHNRDCPHLMHLEVGYNAPLRLAGAGLTFSF